MKLINKKTMACVCGFLVFMTGMSSYAFFLGPLFPYCPYKPGFDEMRLRRC